MKQYKVYFILFFSIIVSFFILYYTLDQDIFVWVGQGKGTYQKYDESANALDSIETGGYILSNTGDYHKITYLELLQDIRWNWQVLLGISLAILGMIGRDLGYIIRIRTLTGTSGEKKLSWQGAFRTIMVWEFSSAISPGVVGGAGVAMFILNKEGIALGRSTAIVFFTALLDNLFYLLAVPILLLLLPHSDVFPDFFHQKIGGFHLGIRELFWFGYILIALISGLLFLSLTFFPNLLKRFFEFLWNKTILFRFQFLAKFKANALAMADDMHLASKDIRHFSLGLWLKTFGLTCLSWISRYLVVNAIIFAFVSGLSVYDHSTILSLQLVFWVILLITPTPGGAGIAEFVFSKFLGPFFPNKVIGSVMAVIWRLISYYPYLLIGALILPKWLSTKEKNQ